MSLLSATLSESPPSRDHQRSPARAVVSDALSALGRSAARVVGGGLPVLARPAPEGLRLLAWPAAESGNPVVLDHPAVVAMCEEILRSGESHAVGQTPESLRFRPGRRSGEDAVALIGVPLPGEHPGARGVLAVLRSEPTHWMDGQREALRDLAHAVAGELERQRGQMERDALSAALAHSEERYHRLFTASPNGIYQVDAQRRFVEINHAAAEILGRPAEELIGSAFDELIAPEDAEAASAAFRDAMQGQAPGSEIELRLLRPGGERRTVRISRTLVLDNGVVIAVQGVARDVTEERAREMQLRRAERMASIAPMLSGVCHELNNPLTSIKSFAELMLLDERPEEDREALEIMQREAHRAAKIVSDLRIVARQSQEAGTGRDRAQFNDLVRAALDRRRDSLTSWGVELRVELDPDLPPVRANGPQMEQVVLQLLSNAEHALKERREAATLTVHTFRGDLGPALLIGDNGPGIARENHQRIFDPFWTTRDPGQGTGLGLSLAHSIVSDHGGRISVDSEPGLGARFTVELPAAPEISATPEAASSASASRGLRILVVDDEAPIRYSLARYMDRRGHQVREAAEGGAALKLLEESTIHDRFDIIVADLRMPGLDGEKLLEQLRLRGDGLDQRLIFITGDAESPDADRVLRDAGVPVVWKPFELAEVAQIIEAQAGIVGR